MEQFDIPHQRVREKSVYLLHLDTARIILISAAVIAIIIVSFLLGMNFIKRGEGSSPLTLNQDIFDSHKDLDLLKNNIPEPSDEEELSKPLEEKLGNVDKEGDKKEKSAQNKSDSSEFLAKQHDNEQLTKDAVASKKNPVRKSFDQKKLSVGSGIDTDEKSGKKSLIKNVSKKKKAGKSKVVEVAGGKAVHAGKSDSSNFVIQVASYDKRTTAQAEIKSLKQNKYDAYVDETKVGGKQYFRVRIGPIVSKKKALELLSDIQNQDRYRESYMVRE